MIIVLKGATEGGDVQSGVFFFFYLWSLYSAEGQCCGSTFRHGSEGSSNQNQVTLPMRRRSWQTDGIGMRRERGRGGRWQAHPRSLAALGTITSADRCTERDRKERREKRQASSRWKRRKTVRKKTARTCTAIGKAERHFFLLNVMVKITTSGKQYLLTCTWVDFQEPVLCFLFWHIFTFTPEIHIIVLSTFYMSFKDPNSAKSNSFIIH